MSIFVSGLAPHIDSMLGYREALGYSRKNHQSRLRSLDRFCARLYPDCDTLSKEMVHGWLGEQFSGLAQKASTARLLGRYLKAIGKESYVLYKGFARKTMRHPAYIFTDEELAALFAAIDSIEPTNSEPFLNEIASVLYRLIYTCGLRPGEGRNIKRENIDLKTGEILIVNTKGKKDRMVVMSNDMLKLCRSYDKHRSVFARGSEYFFPSWETGGAFSTFQLCYYLRGAWRRANPETEKSELPVIRAYDLRHRFASAVLIRWLDAKQPIGAKLAYLRAYMGHNSLSETAHYIHLLPENLVMSSGIDWSAFDEIIPEV